MTMVAPLRAELGSRILGYRAEVALQLASLVLVVAAILIALAVDPSPLKTSAFAVAIAIFGAATALAFAIGRSDSGWLLIVPVLDMVALVVMRQVPENHVHAIGYLAVLPALWLGWSGRAPLAVLAVLLSLGLVELPGTSETGTLDLEHALRNFLTPAMVAVAAASTLVASRRTAASIRSLVEQERVTAASLEREERTSELLDGILDAVKAGILAFDADGRQILANRAVLSHPALVSTGLTPRELETQGYLLEGDRTTPTSAERSFIARALRGDEYSNQIVWVSAPGAGQHALSLSARPLMDRQDRFAGTVIAIDDVTGYLETIAAKDEFVASVSHEFRTPLASIVGYLELILDDEDGISEDVRRHLAVIERNAERLQRMVDDLLAAASREPDAVQLERSSTDVTAVCSRVLDGCAKAAAAAASRLDLDAPGPVIAVIDARRVGQAIENVVSNALQFSPFGGTVTVSVGSDRDQVTVSVRNSDVTVDADQMEALASPFSWPAAGEKSMPGVALRLAVTRAIVEEHRGTLAFDCAGALGATVTISLPVR